MPYTKSTSVIQLNSVFKMEYTEWLHDDLDRANSSPIVCVHGHMSGMELFEHFALPNFASNGATWIIALNLPGYGQTTPLRLTTLEGCSELIRIFLEAKDIERSHLVGLSLGGSIALTLASNCPNLVSTVCAHEPIYDYREQFALRHRGLAKLTAWLPNPLQFLLKKSHHWSGMPRLRGMLTNRVDLRLFDEMGDDYCGITSKILRSASWHSLNEYMVSAMKFRGDFHGIRCPALITAGEQTAFFAKDSLVNHAYLVPGAEKAVIPQAGHMAPLSHPVVYAQVVTEFIGRHEQPVRFG